MSPPFRVSEMGLFALRDSGALPGKMGIDKDRMVLYNRSKSNDKEAHAMFFWDRHKAITDYYELLAGRICQQYGLTQMEYDILMFLQSNPQHNTAAEIVKVRKSTKSHVSISLKRLEDRGLIERTQSPDNKKHIEIALQEASKPIIEAGIRVQKQFAKDILSGLTQEEKEICVRVFCTIYENAQAHLNEDNTIS